jgi:type IV/VI secretion system ImpK/VasF family protein
MENTLWRAIYDVFSEVGAILDRAERGGTTPIATDLAAAAPKPARAPAAAMGAGIRQAFSAQDDLVPVRAHVRSRLDVLKAALAEELTEREVFLALFPVVVTFDEIVQNRFVRGQAAPWPPLQKELFKIDDGGAVFYDTLDDLLRKPETLPFIYEVFYFCLSDGFRGKHGENLTKINEYKHKLEEKIPIPKIARTIPKTEALPVLSAALDRIPFGLYAAAAGVIAVTFLAFYGLASL